MQIEMQRRGHLAGTLRAVCRRALPVLYLLGLFVGTLSTTGCRPPGSEDLSDAAAAATERDQAETAAVVRCDHYDEQRQVFWGDLHVHTAISSDAWRSDVRTRPDDAYRFARGEAIKISPLDIQGEPTQPVRLARPLDFAAVTDHAESFGLTAMCSDPESSVYDSRGCDYYRRLPATPAFEADPDLPPRGEIWKMVCGDDFGLCEEWAARTTWQETKDAAARWDDPSATCRFTTFLAYEWSGSRDGPLLHRNVIFAGADAPFPVSSSVAPKPGDLFDALESECLGGGQGCDVLAIPHNANTSQGAMFAPVGSPASAFPESEAAARRLARQRAELEPLVEIMQHKGDSECRNGLSGVLGEPDELCDFEKLFPAQMPECQDGQALLPNQVACTAPSSYSRYGLAIGMAEKKRLGVNPFQHGFIAATDTHNATPGQVDEKTWQGHVGARDDGPMTRMSRARMSNNAANNPGGIAGVWAEENSRASLFSALRRKETFGTSGPRIAVRLFGGWSLPEDLCSRGDFAARAYATGIPMGGVLEGVPEGAKSASPRFAIQAMADPGTPEVPGADLQRAQVIKVWNDERGQIHQTVFDVAGDASNGASVDLATCEPQGSGERTLCSVWEDPDFDPAIDAVYYARVVENPTCRWTTSQCAGLSGENRPAGCDVGLPKTVQERAWTSPIWFEAEDA